MDPASVGQVYDRLADHWASDRFNRLNGIEAHRKALAFVETKGAAIDIGCGSSGRLIDLMLDQGFQAEGLDVSTRMIELAKERHPKVTFHHADLTQWEPPRKYDFISAWDSVWHVPLDQQEAVLEKLYHALAPAGVMITTTGGVEAPDESANPCLGEPMYHAAIGLPRFLNLIHESGCHCRHVEFDQWPEKHVVVIAQRG